MTESIYLKSQRFQVPSCYAFLNDCRNIMIENGLEPPQNLMTDGTLHRCGTIQKPRGMDASYIIHLTEPHTLWWKNWRSGEEGIYTAKPEGHMSSAHRRALHERRKAEATQREQDKLARHREAAQRANELWEAAIPATDEHAYLKSKGVPSLGLRVTRGGHLVIPVMDIAGKCQSLQFIPPDGKAKRFLTGGKMQGGFFHLRGNSKDTNHPLCICEGYATAASVHMATGYACLIAFNAGNLTAVAHIARQIYPERTIMLCADNDTTNTINVGVEKARAAAKESNALLAIPPCFAEKSIDFNDLHRLQGLAAVKECIDKATTQKWKTPIPFDDIHLPTIEPRILPPVFSAFCNAVTEGLQVPFELVFAITMACVSCAVQGKFVVQVRDGYLEPLNSYWIAPLPPSELKSPTMKLCKAPLEDYERTQNAEEASEIKKLQSEQTTLAKSIEYKRSQVARSSDSAKRNVLIEEIQELEAQLKDIPTYTRLLVDDATPEALGQLMAQHDGKIAHLEAETALLDNVSGRYSHGKPNLDVLLKGYSVEPLRIDRRGSEPVHISQPHITLCVTPQPYALQSRGASEAFRGRGLDARCLFLLPKSAVGSRNMAPAPIEAQDKQGYHDHITTLLEIEQKHTESGQLNPYILHLDIGAYSQWLKFACAVEKALGIGGELALMQDWGGKIRGNVVRLAGLLHCAQHHRPQDAQISGETMANACYLGTILIAHAKAAYGLMGEDQGIQFAKRVLHWIQNTHQEEFSVRDCQIALRSVLQKSEVAQATLDELEIRDYILKKESSQRQAAGRPPSPRYMVNPLTHQKA